MKNVRIKVFWYTKLILVYYLYISSIYILSKKGSLSFLKGEKLQMEFMHWNTPRKISPWHTHANSLVYDDL